MANPLIVDGRNFLDPARLRAAGFTYEGIGRRSERRADGGSGLMQALVLVGGEGTRLRPLTLTQPKPALPLVDRPFIRYMVDWLGRHGVDEVVMACGFRAEDLRDGARRRGARRARDPLRRGARAARHRRPDPPRRRRGAARRALPGPQRRRAHRPRPDRADAPRTRTTGAGRRSALHPVDDPSSYGLVRRARGRRGARRSSRSPTRPRSTPTRSTPAPTCSSARSST